MAVRVGIPACFPPGEGDILLSNLLCNGEEPELFDCHTSGEPDCLHFEDAGLRCLGLHIKKKALLE